MKHKLWLFENLPIILALSMGALDLAGHIVERSLSWSYAHGLFVGFAVGWCLAFRLAGWVWETLKPLVERPSLEFEIHRSRRSGENPDFEIEKLD